MFRYLVAYLPGFRLERCGWEPLRSAVLVDEQKNALRVQSATPPVQRLGVVPGMSLSAARALAPELAVEILDVEAETADLEELAAQLLCISASVAPMPPHSLVAEIGRTRLRQHRLGDLAGRERSILERTRIRLRELGHSATVVIADDPETARVMARGGGRSRSILPGESRKALSELPLEALSLPGSEQDFLQSLGLRSVGEFSALPAASIATRMGALGVAAHAMARGQGPARLISPWTDQRPLMLSQDLPDPVVQLDALLFILNSLLRDACSRLATEARAACQISLHFTLEEGSQNLSIQLGEPTRSANRVLALLRHRMERFKLAGPVTALALEISESTPFHGRQATLMDRSSRTEAIADVAARLQDSLGQSRVSIPELQSRHRPEASWRARPIHAAALETPRTHRLALMESRILAQDPVHHWQGHPQTPPPSHPPLMLASPLAIDVRTPPGGIPLAVQVDGSWVEITACSGPEQIQTEWWNHLLDREYWRVHLSDGRRAWIYKEDGQWALHGWWDR